MDVTSVGSKRNLGWKRSISLLASVVAAALGSILLLIDLWVLVAVSASEYRLWPVDGRSELAHPWLWLGVLPVTALLLFFGAFRMRSLEKRLGDSPPEHATGPSTSMSNAGQAPARSRTNSSRSRHARQLQARHTGRRPRDLRP